MNLPCREVLSFTQILIIKKLTEYEFWTSHKCLRVLLAHWTWIILANKDFWKNVVNAGVWPRFSDYGCKIAVLWKHVEASLHFRRKDCGKNRKLFWHHILVFIQIRKRFFLWLNIQKFLLLRLVTIASTLSLRIFLFIVLE